MPSFLDFLSRSNKGTYNNAGTDADAWRAIGNAQSVRTIAPVTSFQVISKGQLEASKRGLQKRREQSQMFGEHIQIVHEWRDLDVADTKVLAKSLVKEATQISEAQQAIYTAQVDVEKTKVGVAKAQDKMLIQRRQVAQEIEKLRQQRDRIFQRQPFRTLPTVPQPVEVN